jgi:hypothetical protein
MDGTVERTGTDGTITQSTSCLSCLVGCCLLLKEKRKKERKKERNGKRKERNNKCDALNEAISNQSA